MRRERNQYIFASELTKRNRSHRFRNAVLDHDALVLRAELSFEDGELE